MWVIGVDYHPSVQQIALVNTDTGEYKPSRVPRKRYRSGVPRRSKRWLGRTDLLTATITASPGLVVSDFIESEMAHSRKCNGAVCLNCS
jgi:hypothetical protein